jgi:hypothetical protein
VFFEAEICRQIPVSISNVKRARPRLPRRLPRKQISLVRLATTGHISASWCKHDMLIKKYQILFYFLQKIVWNSAGQNPAAATITRKLKLALDRCRARSNVVLRYADVY